MYSQNLSENLKKTNILDLLFITLLSSLLVFFVSISSNHIEHLLLNKQHTLLFILSCVAIVSFTWFYLLSTTPFSDNSNRNIRLSLSPLLILIFLIPYKFAYPLYHGEFTYLTVTFIFLGVVITQNSLINPKWTIEDTSEIPFRLKVIVIIYTIILGFTTLMRYYNFQNSSSFDIAIYSQIQWNNIHGFWLESSTSGSNFVTHNSPFLILLSPFYFIYPHIETLLVVKAIFLGFSAFPFYKIINTWLKPSSSFALTLGFLFYPFIIGQQFNAPHEMCFATPFLLWTFYFLIKDRFNAYILMLLLTLTIKEHLALYAICLGIYSIFIRKHYKWILSSLIIGVLWALFSLWIMHYFQKIHTVDPSPAWLIENIKERFLNHSKSLIDNIIYGLQTSNLGNFNGTFFIYVLLSPLLILLPFLSVISIISLPELTINLLANVPIMYPNWHYNIVVSCFLLIALAKFLSKIEHQQVLSWFICISILAHGFLWWDFMVIADRSKYANSVNQALKLIPPDSSVKAPKELVAYVCNRRDYYLLEDKRTAQYWLFDTDEHYNKYTNNGQKQGFRTIFQEGSIRLLILTNS